ncbi:hypothetical protein PaG_03788 [Moesziomyces aphidis]|uniref:Effector family protein Eff1 n=1 Tax=Moesziomyces aphidis TaxID=84754 RepID=W3VKM4_MOEAP|nr:hypothetical protein PaG_03788 [Moesziomyces aphidis]
MELSWRLRCQLGALLTILFISAIPASPTGGGGWDIGEIVGHGARDGGLWGQNPAAWLNRDLAASSSGSHGGRSEDPGYHASHNSRMQSTSFESPRQSPIWSEPRLDATEQRSPILHGQGAAPVQPAAAPIVTSESETGSTSLLNAPASSQPLVTKPHRIPSNPRAPLAYAWFGEDVGRSMIENGLYKLDRANTIFRDDVGEWEKWLANMRRATGRPSLRISPVDVSDSAKDQVFVAEDLDTVDHPPLTESERVLRWSGRLLLKKVPPGKVEHNLEKAKARDRVYVYLNSRRNMDYINREYFLGHARPLPIHIDGLTRNSLNKIYAFRNTHVLFPPRTQHGLPLLVVRHIGSEYTLEHIHSITGIKQKMHLMSLWSPLLFDGQRYTTFLYGVVGFDSRHAPEVLAHLDTMTKASDPSSYASLYVLEEAAHMFQ